MRGKAVELRHLRYFVAVAHERHFARAAERLGIAAPTLTVQIQDLERSLQAKLLDRHRGGATLTYAGEVFLAEASDTLARFDRAVLTGRRAGRGEIGGIEIGYVGSAVFSGVLQRVLHAFRAQWPDVTVKVRDLPMAGLAERVEDGTLDMGFVRMPVSLAPALRAHTVARDRFCVALPSHHRLAGESLAPLSPRLLSGERFVVPEQPTGTYEVGRRGGFVPDIVAELGSLVAVLTQVSLGTGVAVVPDVLHGVIRLPEVVLKPIAGAPIASEVAMIHRADERSPAARQLIQRLRDLTPDPVPAGDR